MNAPLDPLKLPHNLDAEQAVLGLMLSENEVLDVLDGLRPHDFHEPFHGELYDFGIKAITAGRRFEPMMAAARFKDNGALDLFGGLPYLSDLVDRAPPVPNASEYATIIRDAARRREIIAAAREAEHEATTPGAASAEEIVSRLEARAAEIAESGATKTEFVSAAQTIRNAIASARARDGKMEFNTGLSELDEKLGGLNRGEHIVIAGRPGMGKTLVAGQIAKANAARGMGTCLFSLEMSAEAMGLRMAADLAYDSMAPVYMSQSANPSYDNARKNRLSIAEWSRMNDAGDIAETWPLHLDFRVGLTVSQIEAAARRAHRRWRAEGVTPGPVIVDHLGKVRPETQRQGSKHAEVADVSGALARLAKRLGVPVISFCQLNRGVEGRDDKRPQLSDLRQAGEIEEDARVVLFLYRPEYYYRPPLDPSSESAADRSERETKLGKVRNKLFFLVEKNSSGSLGQVETFCDVACAAIRDRLGLY